MGKIFKPDKDYRQILLRNTHQYFLQRPINDDEYQYYSDYSYEKVIDSILDSKEYENLHFDKLYKRLDTVFNNKIDYTIIKVNDRGLETIKRNADIMGNNFIYHNDITFFDYRKDDYIDFFSKRNIKINWLGERFDLKNTFVLGEMALVASNILVMEYIIKNSINEFIVFEDDVLLYDTFVHRFAFSYNELPKDFDFLADMTLMPNLEELTTEEKYILIDSDYICKSYLQNAHLGFAMYSYQGAKKILEAYQNFGIICPWDTFIFYLGQMDILNGFTTFRTNKYIETKDLYGSFVEHRKI